MGKLGANVSAIRNTAKMIISAMNMRLRPYASAKPPRAVAPTRMPAREAAVTRPLSAAVRWNWIEISGRATPVMNTTMPSKNLPAQASAQIRNCMAVIGVDGNAVPSGQLGRSSMYSCTVFPLTCGLSTVVSSCHLPALPLLSTSPSPTPHVHAIRRGFAGVHNPPTSVNFADAKSGN